MCIPPQVLLPLQADPTASDVCDRRGTGDKTEEPQPVGEEGEYFSDSLIPRPSHPNAGHL